VSFVKRKSSIASEGFNQSGASTPDTPYGQVFQTPTASSKTRWKKFIAGFPSFKEVSPSKPAKIQKRKSTPLSEIKRKIWAAPLESSDVEANPNYSIEEMEEDHENENDNQNISTPLNNENIEAMRRVSINTSRSTPTAEDFK